MRRLLILLTMASVFAVVAPAAAHAHAGEAPNTWYPSRCWAGAEVWHYSTGTASPDSQHGHWWTNTWDHQYHYTFDAPLQAGYFSDGGDCGAAQFVTSDQQIYGTDFVLFYTKCALYYRPMTDTHHVYRSSLNVEGCTLPYPQNVVINV